MSEIKETIPAQLVAGAIAGMIAEGCTHPVDTIRARLQTQRGAGVYRGLIQSCTTIIKSEGIRGLYGGLGPVLLFTVPAHSFYFGGYELTKLNLQKDRPIEEKSGWVHFTAGMVAEFFGALIWTPQDIIKQRLQILPPGARPASTTIIKNILASEGPRGLFRGLDAGILTYGPFVGFYFVFYEQSKVVFKKVLGKTSDKDLPFFTYLISGGFSGGLSAALTCPLDVIKTRIQVQDKSSATAYKGVTDAFRSIVQKEGLSAFWKGLSARIFWIAPSCAITIGTYEELKIFFSKYI